VNELSQSLHHCVANELAISHFVGSQCTFNAARLEKFAIAVPGFVYAVLLQTLRNCLGRTAIFASH
jgi:hypothetical protein